MKKTVFNSLCFVASLGILALFLPSGCSISEQKPKQPPTLKDRPFHVAEVFVKVLSAEKFEHDGPGDVWQFKGEVREVLSCVKYLQNEMKKGVRINLGFGSVYVKRKSPLAKGDTAKVLLSLPHGCLFPDFQLEQIEKRWSKKDHPTKASTGHGKPRP